MTGFVFSTSFLNRAVLGEAVPEFERDLAEALGRFDSDGLFRATASYAYELARKPD